MGVRIIYHDGRAVFYSSSTDWAFGPVLYDGEDHDAEERAEAFCEWLAPTDPRTLDDDVLEQQFSKFLKEEADYWKKKKELEEELEGD